MRYDERPVHRKLILPWYDSDTACFIMLVFAILVFAFALVGISVAGEGSHQRVHVWLPVLLAVLSGGVIVSTAVRLINRYRYRYWKGLKF